MLLWSCDNCSVPWVLTPALIITIVTTLHCYLAALPSPASRPIRRHGFDMAIDRLLYVIARALAIPRLVFVPIPWLAKRCVALVLRMLLWIASGIVRGTCRAENNGWLTSHDTIITMFQLPCGANSSIG